jgi:MSHA biogenesis protein MshK
MAGTMKLILLALASLSTAAYAQTADPTRPPAAMLATGGDASPGGEAASAFRLQSVLVPHGGRPVAVIGGRTVALGDSVGGAKLVRLNEREAVLQGADGVTHLYLTPDVEKQMIVMPKSRKAGKSGPTKDLP